MARKIGKGQCTEEDFELEKHLKAGEEKKIMQENKQKDVCLHLHLYTVHAL